MSSPKNKGNTTSATAGGGGDTTATAATGSSNKKSKQGNNNNNVISTGLLDYLQNCIPRKTLLSLYMEDGRGRFVVRAVLQELSLLAQQIIIRLHCTGGTFPLSGINLWIATSGSTTNNTPPPSSSGGSIYKELYKWAIIQDYNTNGTTDIALTIPFAKGLHASLTCLDSSPWVPLNKNQLQTLYQQHASTATSGDESGTSKSSYNNKRGGGAAPSTTTASSSTTTLQLPTPDDLEKHTQYQWDAVLHFLVGTVGQKEPPPAVVHFLLQTNLMQPDPDYKPPSSGKGSANNAADDAPLVITTKGYDFMLQDTYQQVWHFIVQYLYSIEQHPKGEDLLKEAVLLLISLTFARTGCPYAASSLKKDCRTMIKDLSLFGLLYTTKIGKSTIFYPTRLAMQLVGSGSNSTSNTNAASNALWSTSSKVLESSLMVPNPIGSSHLAIIVQTNFQLAAYTTSELHVSMLGLFCDVSTIRRLPNIVMMQITRDSVKAAFGLGIRAEQILRFLEKHTHPKLRKNTFDSPVPSNVVDQIWLWDRELRRVIFTKVYQHQCVMGIDEFKAVQQYSIDKGIHSFTSERKQLLLLDYKYYDRIQAFVRQWRAQTISRQKE